MREYVVGFWVVMVWGFFLLRDDGLRCWDYFVFGYFLLEDLTGKSSRGWLKSPEGTAPEVRNAPNRGRRRASAGIKEPEGDEQKYFLVIP